MRINAIGWIGSEQRVICYKMKILNFKSKNSKFTAFKYLDELPLASG